MIEDNTYVVSSDHEYSEGERYPFKTKMESRATGDVLLRLLKLHPSASVMITSIPANLDAPSPRWQVIAFEHEEILETFMRLAEGRE